jgi:hypothetical protein
MALWRPPGTSLRVGVPSFRGVGGAGGADTTDSPRRSESGPIQGLSCDRLLRFWEVFERSRVPCMFPASLGVAVRTPAELP